MPSLNKYSKGRKNAFKPILDSKWLKDKPLKDRLDMTENQWNIYKTLYSECQKEEYTARDIIDKAFTIIEKSEDKPKVSKASIRLTLMKMRKAGILSKDIPIKPSNEYKTMLDEFRNYIDEVNKNLV